MKELLINLAKFKFAYLLLAAVAFLSYHQLLQMYFWRDDYSTLYAVQQGNLLEQPIFAYPYHLNIIMSDYFWHLFGLQANYYFGTEIILFILASWILYYLVQRLFTDKRIAFFCALVFSAGYLGQDALKMSLEGLLSLTALNLSLLTLLTLVLYLQSGRKLWFSASLLVYFLALEIAAHRTISLIIILLFFNLILSGKKRINKFFLRSLPFLIIFVVQYFFHPSVLIFNYKVGGSINFGNYLANFSPLYLFNPFGTFWNMIVPSDWQETFYRQIDIYNNPTPLKFWFANLPAVVISSALLLYLKLLRPKLISLKIIILWISLIISGSAVLAHLIYQLKADRGDLVANANGVVLFIFLMLWIIIGACKSRSLSFLSLVTLFGLNMLFFLTIPDRVLVTYNRYLLAPSFTLALLPVIFVTKEFYLKDHFKRRLAVGLFVVVCLLLVISRFWYALVTQKEFVTAYSQHSKMMYQQLYQVLPDINTKQIIYIEGANKELSLSVGDAARVGFLGSEAAYAVHYKVKKERIILPQTLVEIPQVMFKNPELTLEDVRTFIYDKRGLRETTPEFKKFLNFPKKSIKLEAINWQKNPQDISWTLKPTAKIVTFLPLEVKLQLKFPKTDVEQTLEFSWRYNTIGLLDQPKSVQLNAVTDGGWHEYKFTIPGGGEYLQALSFDVPNGTSVEIGPTQFSYIPAN